jgi:hypothetical protein
MHDEVTIEFIAYDGAVERRRAVILRDPEILPAGMVRDATGMLRRLVRWDDETRAFVPAAGGARGEHHPWW